MTNEVITRLDEEIKATENLISEGDPFLITKEAYLDNLKWIRGITKKEASKKE